MAIDDLSKVMKNISKIIEEAVNNKTLDTIGSVASERIQKRTRIGKGVKANKSAPHALPKLKLATVKERTRLKKKGDLTGPGATPSKSALNRSGDMLGSINHKVKGDTVAIRLSQSGEKKAEAVAKIDSGFEFMNISNAEFKALVKIVSDSITRAIRKLT